MVGKKTFDCVAMKDEIQKRRRQQYAGLSDEQIRQRMREALATSTDPAARKWREIAATEPKDSQSANRTDVNSSAFQT